jgi:hypothetical protein
MGSFLLSDITIHKTVMRGRSTSGKLVEGTVRRIVPGICFEVDPGPGKQRSLLWRELSLVPGLPLPEHTKIVVDGMYPPELRRTDSGADYGFDGFPDCDFWIRQGIPTVFLASEHMYKEYCLPPSPSEMKERLEECKDTAEKAGGEFWKAWTKQMEYVESMMLRH